MVAVDTRASGLMRELKSLRNLASFCRIVLPCQPRSNAAPSGAKVGAAEPLFCGCFLSLTRGPAAVLVDELDRMEE